MLELQKIRTGLRFARVLRCALLGSFLFSAETVYAGVDESLANLEPIFGSYGVTAPEKGPIADPVSPQGTDCSGISSLESQPGYSPEVAALQSVDEVIAWAYRNQSRYLSQKSDSADEEALRHTLRFQIASRLDILYRAEHTGSVNTTDQVEQYDIWRLSNALQRQLKSESSFKSRLVETLRVANLNQKAGDIAERVSAYTQQLDDSGVGYHYGSDNSRMMDCSAFVGNLAEHTANVDLPRTTAGIQAYLGRLKDDDGNKIVVRDPRQIPAGDVFVLAYGVGRGKGSHHTVALLRYPDGTVKVFESTTRKGHRGPQINNYTSIDSFLRSRRLMSGGKIRRAPMAGSLEKIAKIQHPDAKI